MLSSPLCLWFHHHYHYCPHQPQRSTRFPECADSDTPRRASRIVSAGPLFLLLCLAVAVAVAGQQQQQLATMASSTTSERQKTERIKSLLSSYYGGAPTGAAAAAPDSPAYGASRQQQQQQQQQQQPGTTAARPPQPPPGATVSLDSPAFNAERHIAHMIATLPVDRLLAEHKGMAREIKNLDSDMQQLVYENYNKFIAATDTIRSMKANVDGMQADMDALKGNMDTVVERSNSVNAKLLKRRQHIEELNRVQALLAQLQAVFELPRRMQAALQEDALDSAVCYYAEAVPVLRKYGHKGAFRGVAVQADAAAKQISAVLKRRLAERKDDTEHVVLLLRQLGEGDDTLQEKYLQGRTERMQRILKEAASVADAMAAAQQGGSSSSLAAGVVENAAAWGVGPDGAPPSLSVFVKALDERLINAMQETVLNMNGIFLQSDRTPARRKPLVTVAKQLVEAYFKLIRRAVADASQAAVATAACLGAAAGAAEQGFSTPSASLAFTDAWGADVVLQAMGVVSTDIGLLHNHLPELSLREWAAAAVEQAVQGHIAAAFAVLRERITTGVKQLQELDAAQQGPEPSPQVAALPAAYSYLCEAIQQGTSALIKGLRVYEQGRLLSGWQDQLSDAVQVQLQAMFQGLSGHFIQLAQPKDAGGSAATLPATGLVLVLAKLCMFMENTTVPHMLEVLVVSFQGKGSHAGDAPPQFVGGEVARRLGTAAQLLLSTYVELHGRSLSQLVQQAVASTNWMAEAPPVAPQPVCGQLLQVLARAEAEVSHLLDSSGRTQGGQQQQPHHHHQRGGSVTDVLMESGGAVERGVAKLFRGKVTPFGSGGLRATQGAVLSAVVIVGLKSLVEHIRLQSLSRAGLQQLQLDVAFLRPRLLQVVGGGDAEPVAQLLEDVVGAGAERSTDPTLLDAAALGALLQQQ